MPTILSFISALPISFLQGASLAVKDILDSTIEDLSSKFFEMFKPSLRCKPPHLHEAIFRDDIFQSEVITRRGLKSADDLSELIKLSNEEYGKRSDDEWENILLASKMFKVRGKPMSEAIKKARVNKFFLGLDNSWMHAP